MAARAGSWGADLRLAGPAVCAWGTGGVFVASPRGAGMAAVVCGGIGLVAVGTAVAARTRPAMRRAFVTIGICFAGSALVAISIVLQTASWSGPDLRQLIEAHRSIDARVEISRPARHLRSPDRFTGEDKYVVQARLIHATGGGNAMDLDAPIVIFAGQRWAQLPPGTVATGRLRVSPAGPGRRSAATSRPHGPPHVVTQASGVKAATASLRTGLREASDGLATDARGLLPGLVDGDTSNVPNSLDQDMKDTGLSHLVAVSGVTDAKRGG